MRITQQKYNFIIYLYKMIIQKIIKNTIDNPKIQSDFLDDISKIRIKKFITTSINKKKLKFISQNGGDIKNIMINNNEYFYNIETAIANDDNNEEYILNLITIDGYSGCGTILYNVKNKKAIITSVSNIKECIFTKNLDIKYKVGDILMQILIELVKNNNSFDHIKTIELQDNSIKRCYGIGLKLKYLRTITDGIPYYAKFGFRPIENEYYEIFCYNREHHKKINLISSIIIDEIFEKSKNKNNQEPYKIYKSLFKNFILSETKIDIKILLRKMIEYGENEKVDTKNKKLVCELLSYIIKPLYIKLGYKDYDDTLWALKIR